MLMLDLTTDEYYNDIVIWGYDSEPWFDFDESNSKWADEPEDSEEESDEDYLNYAEDALMESYLFGDC